MLKVLVTVGVIFAGAGLASAEALASRPKGCVLVATTQNDRCEVENHFRCTGTGPVAFRTEFTDGNGGFEVQTFDANHGTIEIASARGGFRITAKTVTDHPREVVAKGSGQERAKGRFSSKGNSQGSSLSLDLAHIGQSRRLAGKTFQRISYAGTLTYPESSTRFVVSGSRLYSAELDLLIAEVDVPDGKGKPVRPTKLKSLALEGDRGFGSTSPAYGCAPISSLALPRSEAPT